MLSYEENNYKNYILREKVFNIRHQAKYESIMHLANGYLGIRSALEETYPYQTRGMFVAGTFNRCGSDVTELPNAADTCSMDILLDDEPFSMTTGKVENYERYLNLYTGEVVRKVKWTSPKELTYELTFRRFVSNVDLHTYAIQVRIRPYDSQASVKISTGINARMTNSGTQHFLDGMKRVVDKKYLFLSQTTTESNIIFAHGCCCDAENAELLHTDFEMERRLLTAKYSLNINQGETAVFNKISVLFTSNDFEDITEEQLLDVVVRHLAAQGNKGYELLFKENLKWYEKFWHDNDICIETKIDKIVLAARYAQFCLQAMMPPNSRSSIAAKGLSGEGYKGHVFWDTEIFMLPYFLHTDPRKARRLLDYRIRTLDQCMKNACKNGYRGIMFPWESAATGEEETPKYASMNILTGKAARVWAGEKEHHITADVAYAAYNYYKVTEDISFLEQGGALLIIGCALFWVSRAKFNAEKDRFEIYDIIGPDEYTEHVDNNAYTNYMACEVAKYALDVYGLLTQEQKRQICLKLGENDIEATLKKFAEKIYLPQPDDRGVIPQDDTFFGKKIIDIKKYRDDNTKQRILKDYSRSQVNDMQVLKQADVVMLMYVLGEKFSSGIKKSNLYYYEPKTIHDSSLSRAIHSIVACECNEIESAYEHFLSAIDIDIGDNPVSSDLGIHAAAMGGIWLSIVEGFAGVRIINEKLHINPRLPEAIHSISFKYYFRGPRFDISVSNHEINISCDDEQEKTINVAGKDYTFYKNLKVPY